MRIGMLALVAVTLTACGAPKDEPDKENVASSLEWAYSTIFIPETGYRLVIQDSKKLTYTCTPLEGMVKQLECVTGGKITVGMFRQGVELQNSPDVFEPEFDLVFDKREEGWVVSRMVHKSERNEK